VTGFCEHGNEPSGSTEGGEFLDYLNDYKLLKKDSIPYRHKYYFSFKFIIIIIIIIIIIEVFLCLNRAPRSEGVLGNGGITPRIPDLGARWR
jgi:hypothetical protein